MESIIPIEQEELIEKPIVNELPTIQYLEKDNCLSEYKESIDEQARVRNNINVPSTDITDNLENRIDQVNTIVSDHINPNRDPHNIEGQISEAVQNVAKTDQSNIFTKAQSINIDIGMLERGSGKYIPTKEYVDTKIDNSSKTSEKYTDQIKTQLENTLKSYAQYKDVFTKSNLYTKSDIDTLLRKYIKKDGSTSFESPQNGKTPQIGSHLTTKSYVDNLMSQHTTDVDPHGFLSIINNRLQYYIKKKDVFDKTQTYSRSQLDSIIHRVIDEAIEYNLQYYQDSVDSRLESIREEGFVKSDGSIPFTSPQEGVDAVYDNELITLQQLNKALQNISKEIDAKECIWRTSGPVESTVGFIEDNTQVPEEMSLQEVCDAIFYGKGISIDVPDYTTITNICPITVCIKGSISLVQYAEIYQNDQLIYTFNREQFESNCITVDSLPITSDTNFIFKAYYSNGIVYEVNKTVKCSLPTFIGLLPKWKFGNTITMEYLKELQQEDIEGTQNRFVNFSKDTTTYTFTYKFQDSRLRHPFIVLPEGYPNLDNITIMSQKFGIQAFDVIDMIPLQIEGVEGNIIYKIYIYKQALSSLNQEVTFNFSKLAGDFNNDFNNDYKHE